MYDRVLNTPLHSQVTGEEHFFLFLEVFLYSFLVCVFRNTSLIIQAKGSLENRTQRVNLKSDLKMKRVMK